MRRLKRMLGQRLRRRSRVEDGPPGAVAVWFVAILAIMVLADVIAFYKVFRGNDRMHLNVYYQPVTTSGMAVGLAIINLAMIWYLGSSYWHKWKRRRRQ